MTTNHVWPVALLCVSVGVSMASADRVLRPGEWQVHMASDGSGQAVLAVAADEARGLLMVRCKQGSPDIAIMWSGYLTDDAIPVAMRVDGASDPNPQWPVSPSRRETAYPGDDAALLRSLLRARSLTAQITAPQAVLPPLTMHELLAAGAAAQEPKVMAPPPSAPPKIVTAAFDLRGLGQAVGNAGGACVAP